MNPTQLMPEIPVYLKTSDNMPRPRDPEYYLFTRSGVYLCRNHLFFQADSPANRMPGSLADHAPSCRVAFPPLGRAALEYVVGFFDEVYFRHGAEAIVLLLWDLRRKRYRLCVPRQKASVWKAQSGLPCPIDVTYEVPTPLPRDHLLIGDIHSHADLQAYSSSVDTNDARYRDGVHVVVGRVDREPPEFHVELTVDGFRFKLQFNHFFKGYHSRRRNVPQSWLDQVEVSVSRPTTWVSTYDQSGYQNTAYSYKPSSSTSKKSGWDGNA